MDHTKISDLKVERNQWDQPVGTVLQKWKAPTYPPRETMKGRFCSLEPLEARRHAESLYAANGADKEGRNWTYLPYGPFETFGSYREWIEGYCSGSDPQFYAIIDHARGAATGVASYLRINPEAGTMEVGHIHFSPLLQCTPAATEAMFLMMERAFELGYRRYEWKCDALNAPSRKAALRFGFSFEGVFRQATIVKGRNRDTAWYAAIDAEWPALSRAFQHWLSPSNFDERGRQRTRLAELTGPIRNQCILDAAPRS